MYMAASIWGRVVNVTGVIIMIWAARVWGEGWAGLARAGWLGGQGRVGQGRVVGQGLVVGQGRVGQVWGALGGVLGAFSI